MARVGYQRRILSPDARAARKRYLMATLVTCAAAAMIGGAIHVVMLGANRMDEMRAKASYDLQEMPNKIRAAGEDIYLRDKHEFTDEAKSGYTLAEAEALLSPEQWAELGVMVAIPAGEFTMGTDRTRTDEQNRPAHTVYLPAYKISKYPVTNAQYARFVADAGHRPPLHWKDGRIPKGEELHPVTMVSWYDSRRYAEWAGGRLPSEAEWEKAARGTDARSWPWGDRMDPTRLNTYYKIGNLTDVMAFPEGASPYGVMDLAGNVYEWIADDFLPYEGSAAPLTLFQGKVAVAGTPQDQAMKVVDLITVDARYKVLRGGSWKSDPFSTAAYHRNYSWPHYASDFFGFRTAADVGASEGEAKP